VPLEVEADHPRQVAARRPGQLDALHDHEPAIETEAEPAAPEPVGAQLPGMGAHLMIFADIIRLRHINLAALNQVRQELEQQLRDTEEKLTTLQSRRNDKSAMILSPEQEKELDKFQDEKLRIRKQLRAVRAGLDKDIKGLGNELKIVNIIVVPIVFAVIALLVGLWRRRQRPAEVVPLSMKAKEAQP